MVRKLGGTCIDDALIKKLNAIWTAMDDKAIRAAIAGVLEDLLDGSDNKTKKIDLLQRNVLADQKGAEIGLRVVRFDRADEHIAHLIAGALVEDLADQLVSHCFVPSMTI